MNPKSKIQNPKSDEFFYAPPECFSGEEVALPPDEALHAAKVLRKVEGDEITIVDGQGTAYLSRLTHVARNHVMALVVGKVPNLNEAHCHTTLCVGLMKNPSRFEFLIEKATELGVMRIVPLLTERTIAKNAKTERWRHLAIAAMKQSMRCRLPVIDEPMQFPDSLELITSELKILCHEEFPDSPTPGEIARKFVPKSCAIWIGPEGGFSPEEISLARSRSIRFAGLGARRLRTETAGIVALAEILL